MATLSPSTPPLSPARMPRRWARKCERYCCLGATYFPLFFVYSITTWAVWVEATIGSLSAGVQNPWIGSGTSFLGITTYLLLNWCYTVAVFTSPGTTTMGNNGYSSLPTRAAPRATSFTVKANGELRFCKKCHMTKPDRAHHCSTCKTCVLKMDHHCPWLANCVGLHNYKAFLLFLTYTTLFCFICFGVSATWVWREVLSDGEYTESLMPINYVMLAVISGIIGLVLAGFTGWHILLASKGQTTIECLEKTRYLSPLRKSMQRQHPALQGGDGGQGYETHLLNTADADEQHTEHAVTDEQIYPTYEAMERYRARVRYEEYLDEQDTQKLPSAFDLGWKRNLLHLFGPRKALWSVPLCTTTGDGWTWEPSPKWLEARKGLADDREAQKLRERQAGWGEDPPLDITPRQEGAGRHYAAYPRSPSSKAHRVLGRSPDEYSDGSRDAVSLQTLHLQGSDSNRGRQDDTSGNEVEVERQTLDRKATSGWPQKVGLVTNTLLGNTLARQKDDVRGWDGQDDEVD